MMQGNGCEEIGEREGQVALASAVLLVTKQLGAEQPSPGGVRGAPAARMEKQTSGKDDENERSPPVCTIPMNEATAPKFSGSSDEPFHRILRAETLSTLSILHPTMSTQRAVGKLKIILPWMHPQNMNLSALKRGTNDGIMTGIHKK
nr:uncharacterized protein LOC115497630 isoform X2 [Taeniopygia guttata]